MASELEELFRLDKETLDFFERIYNHIVNNRRTYYSNLTVENTGAVDTAIIFTLQASVSIASFEDILRETEPDKKRPTSRRVNKFIDFFIEWIEDQSRREKSLPLNKKFPRWTDNPLDTWMLDNNSMTWCKVSVNAQYGVFDGDELVVRVSIISQIDTDTDKYLESYGEALVLAKLMYEA